jgi:hypothetical protein
VFNLQAAHPLFGVAGVALFHQQRTNVHFKILVILSEYRASESAAEEKRRRVSVAMHR